jgi:basic membrane protein A and related proteins
VNSPLTVAATAEKQGVYFAGFHCDLGQYAPNAWLTGQMWNWGPLYTKIAQSVMNGTWKPGNATYTMKDGYTKLAPFGKSVPVKIQQDALALSKRINQGTYTVFQGPLQDRDGNERVAAGQLPDSKLIDNMDWFVPGVEGTLPKKK